MKQIVSRISKLMKLAFKDSKKILFCSLFIFFLIRMLTPIIQPLTMTWIFDALEEGDIKKVSISLISVVAITIFNGVLLYLLLVYLDTWADLITQNSNMKFIKKLIAKPYGSLSVRYENGDLVNRVSEASKTAFSLALVPCSMLAKIMTCIYFAFMLNKLSWQIWCVIVSIFSFIVIITKVQLKIETELNTKMQKAYSNKEIITRELIHNVDFYKMTGLNEYILDEYKKQRDEMFEIGFKQVLYSALFALFHDVIALCGKVIILLLVYPTRLVGTITAGVISALLIIYDNFIEQLEGIRAVIVGLPRQIVPINRYYEVIECINRKEENEVDSCISIKLDGLNLKLDGTHILQDINLSINIGDKVAIIGNNGSGKSTLLKTMLGMYDEDITGNVQYSTKQLIKISSYIPTGHQLFNGTALENIRSSRNDNREILLEEMWLYPDIADVGEHLKDELSDGQKQIVNILRGCYKGADILFGDEVTSSIDLNKHQKVMKELVNQCNTVICITHNQEYLSLFNRIIIMENGKIVADGTFDKIEKTMAYQKWLYGGK